MVGMVGKGCCEACLKMSGKFLISLCGEKQMTVATCKQRPWIVLFSSSSETSSVAAC